MKHCMMDECPVYAEKADTNEMRQNEAPTVYLPPGSNPQALGLNTDMDVKVAGMPYDGGMTKMYGQDMPMNNYIPDIPKNNYMTEMQTSNYAPVMPSNSYMPNMPMKTEYPLNITHTPVAGNSRHMCDCLRDHIGKFVQAYFLVGTAAGTVQEGMLRNVGSDYIEIKQTDSEKVVICALSSAKFIRVYPMNEKNSGRKMNAPMAHSML